MLKILSGLIFTLTITPIALAEPFWGSRRSQPVNTAAHKLKAGQFIWKGDAIPAGPTVAEINLTEQKFYLYRNGVLIGLSTTSTGKRGMSTPTGTFSVLTKIRHHRSRKYNNAPMPYTHHINRTGIAMHAGRLPGYPASHGCIRLPSAFAKLLFKTTSLGMPIIITRGKKTQQQESPTSINPRALATDELYRWQPEKELLGAVSIVISKADKRVLVYRNGIEIGRANFSVIDETQLFGSQAYLMYRGEGAKANPFLEIDVDHSWIGIGLSGQAKQKETAVTNQLFKNIAMPSEFVNALSSILKVGASLYLTDNSVLKHEISDSALVALFGKQKIEVATSKQQATLTSSKEAALKDNIAMLQARIDEIKTKLEVMQKQL